MRNSGFEARGGMWRWGHRGRGADAAFLNGAGIAVGCFGVGFGGGLHDGPADLVLVVREGDGAPSSPRRVALFNRVRWRPVDVCCCFWSSTWGSRSRSDPLWQMAPPHALIRTQHEAS